MKNSNHPMKGRKMTVEPIRELKDIENIKKLLSSNTRNLLLFTLSINNGLRMGDILKIKVSDVCDLKPNETVEIRESKTGKKNILMINKSSYKILHQYIEQEKPDINDYLFKSRKGENSALTVQSVNALVKSWCRSINLKGNYATHSLRKSFGYHQRKHFGVGFEVICKRFAHSNPAVTIRYLGISDKEVNDILMNEL